MLPTDLSHGKEEVVTLAHPKAVTLSEPHKRFTTAAAKRFWACSQPFDLPQGSVPAVVGSRVTTSRLACESLSLRTARRGATPTQQAVATLHRQWLQEALGIPVLPRDVLQDLVHKRLHTAHRGAKAEVAAGQSVTTVNGFGRSGTARRSPQTLGSNLTLWQQAVRESGAFGRRP